MPILPGARLWRACETWSARGARLGSLPLRDAAVVLSAYASLVHDWVLPEHYREWWGYGLFFLVSAAAQAFYAGLLLLWPRRRVYLAGVAGNSAILVLYAVTRTLGIPLLGPYAGLVESVGVPDLVSAMAELALVCILVRLVREAPRAGRMPHIPPPHRRTHASTLDAFETRPDQVERARRRVGPAAGGPAWAGAGRQSELEPARPLVPAPLAKSTSGDAGRHHHRDDARRGQQDGRRL